MLFQAGSETKKVSPVTGPQSPGPGPRSLTTDHDSHPLAVSNCGNNINNKEILYIL